MEIEVENKGTAYLQGIKGLDYLAKINVNLSKPMNVLKKFLSGNPLRKSLYLTFNDGEPKITKGVYQIKVNPKNETFLNSLRDELSKEKQIVDTINTVQGQIITFKSGFQLYASGKKLGNVIGEDGKAVAATNPKISQQEDGFIFNLKAGKLLPHMEINKKVGFNFGEDWYNSYKASFNGFIKEIIPQAQLKNYEFYRDSDNKKLELLNQITDTEILPSAKDNWNPSDVWCVKINQKDRLQKEVKVLYDKAINDKVSIEKLNKFIEVEFKKQNLIGVSLKQVTTSSATVATITKDAKYVDSVKFLGFGEIFKFDVTKTYFDINVKMVCLKLDKLDYMFRFRPRGSSSAVTQNAEGKPPKQGPFDGAVDKANVISVFFPGADNIAKVNIGKSKSIEEAILNLDNQYADFKKWTSKKNHKFVSLINLENKANEQEIRRGLLNTYYSYLIDVYKDHKELFKRFYLASKKVNEFSSIHYKIS